MFATAITVSTSAGPRRIDAHICVIENLNLAVHKRLRNPKQWTVSDPKTGHALGHGITKAKAIADARERIQVSGEGNVRAMIDSQPAIAPATVDWVPPTAKEKKEKPDVDGIAKLIADKSGVDVKIIRAALSGTTGRLLAKRPSDELAGAAWSAIQPNHYKVSIGSLLWMGKEAKEVFEKLSKYTWPLCLDKDADNLNKLGVW